MISWEASCKSILQNMSSKTLSILLKASVLGFLPQSLLRFNKKKIVFLDFSQSRTVIDFFVVDNFHFLIIGSSPRFIYFSAYSKQLVDWEWGDWRFALNIAVSENFKFRWGAWSNFFLFEKGDDEFGAMRFFIIEFAVFEGVLKNFFIWRRLAPFLSFSNCLERTYFNFIFMGFLIKIEHHKI